MHDDFDALVDDALYASRAFVALAVRTMTRSAGITIPQHRAILEVALRGPQSLTSMGDLLGMTPSSTSRLCDRLISKGLMTKRPSPHCGRSIELNVTLVGLALVASILDERRQELAGALIAIPEDDREAVRKALRVVAMTLGEPRGLAEERDREPVEVLL